MSGDPPRLEGETVSSRHRPNQEFRKSSPPNIGGEERGTLLKERATYRSRKLGTFSQIGARPSAPINDPNISAPVRPSRFRALSPLPSSKGR